MLIYHCTFHVDRCLSLAMLLSKIEITAIDTNQWYEYRSCRLTLFVLNKDQHTHSQLTHPNIHIHTLTCIFWLIWVAIMNIEIVIVLFVFLNEYN